MSKQELTPEEESDLAERIAGAVDYLVSLGKLRRVMVEQPNGDCVLKTVATQSLETRLEQWEES